MRIGRKLILGFIGVALLVGFAGYITVSRYEVITSSYKDVLAHGNGDFKEEHEKANRNIVNARNTIFGVVGTAFLLAIGLGFFIVRGIVHITEDLQRSTALIADLKHEIIERERIEKELIEAKGKLEERAWGIQKTDEAIKILYKDLKKVKERADIANKAKSDFLGNMSHELRTPLNAIIGFSELLKDEIFGSLNDKQKEYIGNVVESGRHLLSLINDILDIAKVEAGKMELELSDFDLKGILEDSLSMIKERMIKRDIHVSKNIKNEVGMIRADDRKFKQILLNLLSNAAKFTPEGGRIGVEAEKTNNNEVLISVWDTGIGIEEKDKDKVFEEFKQIDSSLTRKYSGTGLGMPLTKRFVELHGGRVWFESEGKDRGSRFYFTLPLNGPGKERHKRRSSFDL